MVGKYGEQRKPLGLQTTRTRGRSRLSDGHQAGTRRAIKHVTSCLTDRQRPWQTAAPRDRHQTDDPSGVALSATDKRAQQGRSFERPGVVGRTPENWTQFELGRDKVSLAQGTSRRERSGRTVGTVERNYQDLFCSRPITMLSKVACFIHMIFTSF